MKNQEINNLLATKILGWTEIEVNEWSLHQTAWINDQEEIQRFVEDFEPTKHIGDAWMIVEKLNEENNVEIYVGNGVATCTVSNYNQSAYDPNEKDTVFMGETVPLAICFAALHSVGIDISQ